MLEHITVQIDKFVRNINENRKEAHSRNFSVNQM